MRRHLFGRLAGAERPPVMPYLASLTMLGSVPLVQFGTFLLAARMLSLEQFGNLILFQAGAAILVEVAGGGMSEALIRNVARNPDSSRQSMLDFFVVALPTSLLAILINTALQGAIFGLSDLFLLALAFGAVEILSQRMLIMWEQVAIAHGHRARADLIKLFPAVLRFLALAGLMALGITHLGAVVFAYVASGLVSAALCTAAGLTKYGTPAGNANLSAAAVGVPFALIQLMRALQSNLDRILLKAVLSSADVAVDATAMKFGQVGSLPVITMLRMWYPRIFSAGHESLVTLRQLSLRLLTPVLVAAAFSTMVLLVLGPLLPLIIGEQFAKSSALLEVAAPVLILSALSYLGGDVLSGTDRLYLRVLFLVGAITAQALLVLILCPLLGPVGAVAAFYASSLILAVLCWSVVLRRAPSRQVA